MTTSTGSEAAARRKVEEGLLLSAISKSSGARRTELVGLLAKVRGAAPVARPASTALRKVTPAPTTPTRKPVSVSDLYDAGEKMIALAEGGGPLAAEASAAVVRVAKAIVGLNPDAALSLVPQGEARVRGAD